MSKHKVAGGKKNQAVSVVPPPIVLSNEAAQRFELELCWCVQQLEAALSSKKLNVKHGKGTHKCKLFYNLAKETFRVMNILKSNTASLVKKRQVMKVTFDDYRAKMAEVEKKFEKVPFSVKFDSNKSSSGKSRFVKQCSAKLFEKSDKNFKFNFASGEDSEREISIVPCESNRPSPFKYLLSDNSFRFDFGDEVELAAT